MKSSLTPNEEHGRALHFKLKRIYKYLRTMKKAYMTPELEAVEIEVRKMLCASDGNTETPEIPTEPGGHEPNW